MNQAVNRTDKIVVVDDDARIRDLLRRYLAQEGFEVIVAEDAKALARIMLREAIDLIVLDLMMPGEDGLSVCRRLRAAGDKTPVIMLTAKGEDVDRIVGLEVGADDYLTKPFDLRELLARVRAVMRRVGEGERAPAMMGREVRFGRCRLNLDSRKLFAADGEEIAITAMEFDLLRVFAQNPGRVLSRDQILDLAHNVEMAPFDRSVDSRIVRLRRKVEIDPARPEVLKTVRGAGYVFTPTGGAN